MEKLFSALLVAQIAPMEPVLNVIQAMPMIKMQLFVKLALVGAPNVILLILKNAVTATMVTFY